MFILCNKENLFGQNVIFAIMCTHTHTHTISKHFLEIRDVWENKLIMYRNVLNCPTPYCSNRYFSGFFFFLLFVISLGLFFFTFPFFAIHSFFIIFISLNPFSFCLFYLLTHTGLLPCLFYYLHPFPTVNVTWINFCANPYNINYF